MNAQAAQGKPIHVGYDILGKKNSCTKFDLTKAFCTAEFTEEDEFANKCRDKGFTPFACGCHKFLCSEPITE